MSPPVSRWATPQPRRGRHLRGAGGVLRCGHDGCPRTFRRGSAGVLAPWAVRAGARQARRSAPPGGPTSTPPRGAPATRRLWHFATIHVAKCHSSVRDGLWGPSGGRRRAGGAATGGAVQREVAARKDGPPSTAREGPRARAAPSARGGAPTGPRASTAGRGRVVIRRGSILARRIRPGRRRLPCSCVAPSCPYCAHPHR